ncbi:hypothetical protein ACO0LO_18405 [Undibacterium sp. TJN25]|uniref:hypothetical protein n=1 Tax=Undibacterium sp. TJN25 TaxID=3413056 RepID=UPI003BF31710
MNVEKMNSKALIRLIVTVIFFLVSKGSDAQSSQIAEVKVRLFFQYSGEFSQPLNGKEVLWNVMAGGGDVTEPTTSAFVDIVVSGLPNTYVAKQAVDLLVKNGRTGKIVERQRGRIGIYGPSGETHVGFWLRSFSCDPVILVVSTAGSSKSLTLPFRCGE